MSSSAAREVVPVIDVSLAIPTIPEDFHLGWLQQTMKDIKGQTLKPGEVIIALSNASEAESDKITEYVKDTLRPIKTTVTSTKSLSPPGKSRNRALQLARGEIVSFFDGDDRMHPNRLEIIARAFEVDASVHLVLHALKYSDQVLYRNLTYAGAHKVDSGELCEVHKRTSNMHPWLTSESFHFEVAHGHLSIRKNLQSMFMFTEDKIGEDCGFVRSILQVACSREGRIRAVYLDVPLTTYSPRIRRKTSIGMAS